MQLPVGQLLAQLLPPARGPPKVVPDEHAPLLANQAARLDILRVEEEEAVAHKLAMTRRVVPTHQRGQDVLLVLGIHLEEKY